MLDLTLPNWLILLNRTNRLTHLWLIQWSTVGKSTQLALMTGLLAVSWRSWILVIIGLLAGASFGLSVILSHRLRILAASVTTFSLPRHSHALPTILNYFPSTTPTLDNQKFFVFKQMHFDWALDTAVILLLVMIGFMTILKLCRCCEKKRYEFKLYAQTGYQNRSVQICIETFKLQPENYQFSASKYVNSLRVTGCLLPHLKIIGLPLISIQRSPMKIIVYQIHFP